ncbi:MAG TPA: UvrD-helicase domain-containing protein, partial [Polyangiaceae bacterium]|nr:UvrD-helicase domain-containing protein [Polyangiaceae bacterium]
APFADAFRRVAERWERNRVERELTESRALHRGKYKRETLPALCDAMEAYLAAGTPEVPRLCAGFDSFRASYLANACTKGWEGMAPSGPFYTACDWLARNVEEYERATAARSLAFRRRLVDWMRSELPRRKAEAGIMAFDDLLLRLHEALRSIDGERLARAIRRRFPAALIDEFQDTDPIQYGIFDRIWRQDALFLIGDPKQAIYAFRGADVFAYLRAAREIAHKRRFTMGKNWRSDPSLVDAVQAMLCAPRSPFLLDSIALPQVASATARDRMNPALRFLFVRRDDAAKPKAITKARAKERLPHVVAADIARLLRERPSIDALSPSDIAVLTRTNEQAFQVQAALRARAVRAVVLGDQSVFEDEQPDARDVEQLLAAIAEPSHSPAVRAALTGTLLGIRASELARFERDGTWDEWIARFRSWQARWLSRGFVQMFRAFLAEARVFERLLALPGGERRATNVLHLMELLHGAQSALHLGPGGLLAWLRRERANARSRPESAQIRLESDERAVRITTIHKSKGLEYAVVYCPYLWDGRLSFQDERELLFHDDDALKLTLAPETEHRDRAKAERLAESIRLLYVALTRARHQCTVVWGGFKDFETSALGYVLHPPVLAAREPTVSDVRAHLVNLNDERMLRDLSSLAGEHPGAIEIHPVDLDRLDLDERVDEPAPAHSPELRARVVARPVVSAWTTASFTALVSGASLDTSEGRDRDERDDIALEPAADRLGILLSAFPRGARAGNFFHELLEEMDFAEPIRDRTACAERVSDKLAQYRYAPELRDTVVDTLAAVVATPLNPKKWRLCDIGAGERKSELEFHLPVAAAGAESMVPRGRQLELGFAASTRQPLRARELAHVFADHPSRELAPGYAERVARLGFVPLEGFLKGYIDLVFSRDGRFYLADYKTTHLGDTLGAYAGERLPAAMAHAHYYLQYHLYAVALHRHLERRVRGYRYEEHFGGVYYLFIKGMTPATRSGVFFERPPRARIEALSALLQHPGGSRP